VTSPANTTPWTAELLARLADGAWHPLEAVVVAAAAKVPPGVAYREAERDRRAKAAARGNTRPRSGSDEVAVVTVGARRKVIGAVGKLRRRGRVDVDGDRIRLRETTP